MVRVIYRPADGSVRLEVDADGPKEAIQQLTPFLDAFQPRPCGLCSSDQTRVEHRLAGGFDYYSIRCTYCGAQFDFGQHKEGGGLFPKRDKGWYKYDAGEERQ